MHGQALAGGKDAATSPPLSRRGLAAAAGWASLAFLALPGIAYVPSIPFLLNQDNYLAVHSLMEAFACAVSVLIFGIGWYAARVGQSTRMAVLSTAFLSVALLDFAHLLSFQGMPRLVTAAGPDKAIDFWLAARYAQAFGLLGFALCPRPGRIGRLDPFAFLVLSLAGTLLVFWVVLLHPDALPPAFIPGTGLTRFKIAAEYGVMVLLVMTAVALVARRPGRRDFPLPPLFAGVLVLVACEFAQTRYANLSDNYNIVGHVYKVVAFWLICRAVFVRSVTQPYRDLAASEARYRRLTDQAADAILEVDRAGRIVTANPHAEQLTGWPLATILGTPLADWLVPHTGECPFTAGGVVEGGTAIFEAAMTCPDGGAVPVEISISGLDDGGSLAIARDIRERKRSEQAIRIRDTAFAAAMTPIAMATLDAEISYANRAFLDLWGYDSESEILHRPASEFLADPAMAEVLIGGLQAVGQWSGEFRGRRRDGTVIDVQVSATVAYGTDGTPICLIGSFRDITQQKAMTRDLRESEQRFSSFFNASPTGMAIFDTEGRWTHINTTTGRHTPADFLGRRPNDIFEPDTAERVEAGIREVLATGQPIINAELSGGLLAEPGRTYRWLYSQFPLANSEGVITGVGAVVVDMTALADMEVQLRQAQRIDALGKLTGGLAHDSNNYLGVIIGNLDLLQATLAGNSRALPLIEDAMAAALQGADLTRSLLAFARRQPLDPQRIDLNQRIQTVTNLLKRTLGEDITIATCLSADLRPVMIDGAQLDSCIVNLANNARDAMPDGGSLTIATRNVHRGEPPGQTADVIGIRDYALIEVSDTGVGMPPETVARVFEPFFTTKAAGAGTGLGLSMVYGFVKQSGGLIEIESKPGQGTSVRIHLPHVREPVPSEATRLAADPGRPGGTETLLLVEDNDAMRKIVARQLRSLGYQVAEATDASAALAILAQPDRHFDLLFSDIVMPGRLNGTALARLAQRRRPGIKVLLTSGFSADLVHDNGSAGPAFTLLRKPYRINDLALALRAELSAEPVPPA